MYIDRDWKLTETEANGTVVARVQAHDDNGDALHFGLEPHLVFRGPATAIERLPFRINERTGVVYLNESLAGRGGEVFSIYVTVSDGIVELKNEVYVHVLVADGSGGGTGGGNVAGFGPASFNPHVRNVTDLFPAFGLLPGVAGANGGAGIYGGGNGGGSVPPGGLFGASPRPHRTQPHTYPMAPNAPAKPSSPISGHKNDEQDAAEDVEANSDTDDDESAATGGKNPTADNRPQVYTYENNRPLAAATEPTTRLTKARRPPTHWVDADGATTTSSATTTPTTADVMPPNGNDNSSSDTAATGTDAGTSVRLSLPLVLTICGCVALGASLAAVYMWRRHLCAVGRRIKTLSKEEMSKKSNASAATSGTLSDGSGPMGGGLSIGGASSLTGTEDSRNSMVMQNWTGPRAYSNRYVPWERDANGGNPHAQVRALVHANGAIFTECVYVIFSVSFVVAGFVAAVQHQFGRHGRIDCEIGSLGVSAAPAQVLQRARSGRLRAGVALRGHRHGR